MLVDIAHKVAAGKAIDVSNGYLNCIWQGDANEMIIRSLGLTQNPPNPLNLTGIQTLAVRDLAHRFGQLLGKAPHLIGQEADSVLLLNTEKMCALLGTPATPLETVVHWTADWIQRGGRLYNKPTHFEVRDGNY